MSELGLKIFWLCGSKNSSSSSCEGIWRSVTSFSAIFLLNAFNAALFAGLEEIPRPVLHFWWMFFDSSIILVAMRPDAQYLHSRGWLQIQANKNEEKGSQCWLVRLFDFSFFLLLVLIALFESDPGPALVTYLEETAPNK